MSVSDMAHFPSRIVRLQGFERAGSKIEHVTKHRKCIVLFLNATGGAPRIPIHGDLLLIEKAVLQLRSQLTRSCMYIYKNRYESDNRLRRRLICKDTRSGLTCSQSLIASRHDQNARDLQIAHANCHRALTCLRFTYRSISIEHVGNHIGTNLREE
jgi:hypothetical protein